jgi:hypothetical protein
MPMLSVYQLYGLTKEEVAIVVNNLCYEENNK